MRPGMTEEEQKFIDDLINFCKEKGFEIAGTCWYEGIYGEISIKKVGDEKSNGWTDWEENKFNFANYE